MHEPRDSKLSKILLGKGIGYVREVCVEHSDAPSEFDIIYTFSIINGGFVGGLGEFESAITHSDELERIKHVISKHPELKKLYDECEAIEILAGNIR